jgi:hypothetical protein
LGILQRVATLGVLVLFTAAPGKPGCGGSPNTIVGELDDYCHSSNVQCAADLDCVSYYDGGQMICSAPCQTDAHCTGAQVCSPAAQISDDAAASAPLVCQNHCTDLPGSGCGGDPGAPNAIVKWEVAQVGGLYNLRGINVDGDAYLDATIEWAGDEVFSVVFESPAACVITMSIAEATVYSNTCDEEGADAISSVGLDLFTDIEAVLAQAKEDANNPYMSAEIDKVCKWAVGGLGVISAAVLGGGALYWMSAGILPAVGGSVAAFGFLAVAPAIAGFYVAATGCWLNGSMQAPPLSACITECGFGNSPCFDWCIDEELEEGGLAHTVLLPQCVLACEQGDEVCLDACSDLLI